MREEKAIHFQGPWTLVCEWGAVIPGPAICLCWSICSNVCISSAATGLVNILDVLISFCIWDASDLHAIILAVLN